MQVLHHSFGILQQIRSFLTVVEEGSLHRAGARAYTFSSRNGRVRCKRRRTRRAIIRTHGHRCEPHGGPQTLAKRMGAVPASCDLAVKDTRRALRGCDPLD
jgi:hypothetical protein